MRQIDLWTKLLLYAKRLDVPVVVAGDFFDSPNSGLYILTELIRTIKLIGARVYAIPGNHDLPCHDYKQLNRSALGVLFASGAVTEIPRGGSVVHRNLVLFGADQLHAPKFYTPPREAVSRHPDRRDLVIQHKYVWQEADELTAKLDPDHRGRLPNNRPQKLFYLFGDNHQCCGTRWACNPGTFLRRKLNELVYSPSFGVLTAEGWEVCPVESLCEQADELINIQGRKLEIVLEASKIGAFIEELRELNCETPDVRTYIRNRITTETDLSSAAKTLLLEYLE